MWLRPHFRALALTLLIVLLAASVMTFAAAAPTHDCCGSPDGFRAPAQPLDCCVVKAPPAAQPLATSPSDAFSAFVTPSYQLSGLLPETVSPACTADNVAPSPPHRCSVLRI